MQHKDVIFNLVEKDRKIFFDKIFNCLMRFIVNDLRRFNTVSITKDYKLENNVILRNIIPDYPYIFISHFGDDPLLLLLDSDEVKFLFDYILHSFNRDILKGVKNENKNTIQDEKYFNRTLTDIEYRILRMFTNHIFKSVVSALKFRISVDYKPIVCDIKDNETIYLAIDKGVIFNLKLTVNDVSSTVRIFMPSNFIESLLLDFNIKQKERVKGDKSLRGSVIDIKTKIDFVVKLDEVSAKHTKDIKIGDKIAINPADLTRVVMRSMSTDLGYCSLGELDKKIAVKVDYIVTEDE
ncbi:hypothetical protein GUI12_01040 [Anaplasmataceae bacterium AB001_6]|nr:hypothetical protein GUI12_01040 [Anaplasmataceae bacterium AB001_6]